MDRLKTLSLMAEYLLAFDDHPRRVEIDGLRSVSREVRLPLVLISLGRLRDAEACITKFERETEADLASGKMTRVMAACRRCELLAVRRHLDATRQ
jgi:hypothetical protein